MITKSMEIYFTSYIQSEAKVEHYAPIIILIMIVIDGLLSFMVFMLQDSNMIRILPLNLTKIWFNGSRIKLIYQIINLKS